MEEALSLAQKFSSISFPVLMVLILIGSYAETWVWGRQLREIKSERDEWKRLALSASGIAETSVDIIKRRTPYVN